MSNPFAALRPEPLVQLDQVGWLFRDHDSAAVGSFAGQLGQFRQRGIAAVSGRLQVCGDARALGTRFLEHGLRRLNALHHL